MRSASCIMNMISVGKLAVCFAEDRCLMVKRGPSPFLPASCFTSISGWFSALFPAVHPKDPALHRHLPCPCDASPCAIALFYALPLASLPDSPMNSLSARTHLTGILQLTNGLVSSRHKKLTFIATAVLVLLPSSLSLPPLFPLLSAE